MRHSAPIAIAVVLAAAVLAADDPKFTSTWKWMDAGTVSFAGKKVAALVISQDEPLRISGEEALVRELTARGLDMVATYRIIPRPELESADKAKVWYEKAGVEGVVALRPVSSDKIQEYTPGTWVGPTYGSLWGYYGYGWGSVYIPGSSREETRVVVESLVFSLPKNQLLWAGVSETRNPKQLQQFVKDLVVATAKEMQKQGLGRGAAR
jgi:hypothetical protein